MMCIDSDCIIDLLRGIPAAVASFEAHRGHAFTTQINLFEVMQGAFIHGSDKELERAQRFFRALDILAFTDGKLAAHIQSNLIKQGKEISQNDCFIASVMGTVGCTEILTRNIKHFSRIPGITATSY